MSVFITPALDRLIESDHRSSSSSQTSPSMEKQNFSTTHAERRPLYVSYPYSSTTSTPLSPRPRSPSPTDFSPSPYVVNHKRRVPNGLDTKRASQQNGFHVSEKISASRPTESQELVLRSGKENVLLVSRSLNGLGAKQGQEAQLPQGSLTRELQNKNMGGEREDNSATKKKSFDDSFRQSRLTPTEEKPKGKRVGWEKKDMSSRVDDLRGKQKLDERLEEGTSAQERAKIDWGNASTSARSPQVPVSDTSSISTEEWYDAPDAPLSEESSDDEAFRNTPSKPGPSSRGDPDPNIASQLKEEIKRRMRAEEALEALQQQRDEKSKEIARLRDKLQYYETVNHEMSQRNQEAIEIARQTRRRRQRRQRFAMMGLSAAICFGVSAAVVYRYVPWGEIKNLSKGSAFSTGDHIYSESGEKVVDFREPVTDGSYD
ncbi:hypothetical protein MPTK1_1g28580 [Marchantia polymorpha subsp. ruderalis]|uniref:Uncharacterized protein n=2 Tax=Marchantia polymorpha TaxID=3197 RepID=A0AAF6AV98_MARPO|nr:hypothetical protein MARPO_0002s0022 [Marchantia polymorpha]BBN00369.1 hypothetical protein Mp_1g28580 [Marchantia polymorpha subsp. ruderalis]|eukprot:PTQ49513.1 hypothetical protein MARPO_0002s0022 [Marchantia polymorpha]